MERGSVRRRWDLSFGESSCVKGLRGPGPGEFRLAKACLYSAELLNCPAPLSMAGELWPIQEEVAGGKNSPCFSFGYWDLSRIEPKSCSMNFPRLGMGAVFRVAGGASEAALWTFGA